MHCFIWLCLGSFDDYVHYRVFLLILYWHVKIFTFSSLCCHSLIFSLFDSFILLSLFYYSRDLVISLSWFCLLLSGIFSIRFVMMSLFDSFLLVIILLIWSLYCHYLDIIWFCALVGRYLVIILSLSCHYQIMCMILLLFGFLCCHYAIISFYGHYLIFLFCLHYFVICVMHHLLIICLCTLFVIFSSLYCCFYIHYLQLFVISWLVSLSCHYALFVCCHSSHDLQDLVIIWFFARIKYLQCMFIICHVHYSCHNLSLFCLSFYLH